MTAMDYRELNLNQDKVARQRSIGQSGKASQCSIGLNLICSIDTERKPHVHPLYLVHAQWL